MLIYKESVQGSKVNEIYGECGVLLHNALYQTNDGDFSGLEAYPYRVISTDGIVLQTNDKDYSVGDSISMKLLSGISMGNNKKDEIMYSSPYLQMGKQIGTIYVSIQLSSVTTVNYGIRILLGIVIIYLAVILFFLGKMLMKDLLYPIERIHKLTNQIREGRLEEALEYD